jgi:glycosyltransferase involved in cell wall biosynthesis
MKKISVLFVAIYLTLSMPLQALTSSVAVPCYYKHFKYLPDLLKSITNQTILPEKVVISLSQVENLSEVDVDNLEAGPWPFEVDIIRREGVFMEGANRTTAVLHCTSEIVLCIDADDIPHPQRIEAVLQLFETMPNTQMVLCGHAYPPGEHINVEKAIPIIAAEDYKNRRFELGQKHWLRIYSIKDLQNWSSGVHNGSPSIRRSIMDKGYKWTDLKNGADQEFNNSILKNKHESYLIKLPLLHYYNGRSSGADVGRNNGVYKG